MERKETRRTKLVMKDDDIGWGRRKELEEDEEREREGAGSGAWKEPWKRSPIKDSGRKGRKKKGGASKTKKGWKARGEEGGGANEKPEGPEGGK